MSEKKRRQAGVLRDGAALPFSLFSLSFSPGQSIGLLQTVKRTVNIPTFVYFESTIGMEDQDKFKESFALEALIRDYYVVLLVSCVVSLIMGSPLACNVLWHLKVRF